MTNRDIVLAQIRHRETNPVPYWFTIDEEVAQRLDIHYGGRQWRDRIQTFVQWTELVNGDKKEPTGVPHRQRDPYGSVWRTDQRVFHLEVPALPEPTLAGYQWPAPEAFYGDAAWVEKAQKICREKKGQAFLTTWLGWGLFETSWGLRGFENVMVDVACETAFYEALLDRVLEQFYVWIDYICRTLPEVDAIFLGDDWSDQRGVIIGPDRWREIFKPRYAKLYEYIHAKNKLIIEHVCGSVSPLIPDLIDIGLDVLESVQPEAHDMTPYELKRRWGDKITFMGGLGSQSTLQFGKPEEVRAEIRRLRTEMSRGGGYILAPSKFLQPGTPTGNAVAAFEEFTAS